MIINNYADLATSEMRAKLLDIIDAGIRSVEPNNMIHDTVSYNHHFNSVIVQHNPFDLLTGRIFVIGGGKAVGRMAEALEGLIGAENITAGIVSCKTSGYKTEKIKIVKASHPLPDEKGVDAVKQILSLKDKYDIGKKDLVITLLSGGCSALLPMPVEGVSLGDKQKVSKLLLDSGAKIGEVNAVRKHLSRVKGGRLAEYFQPARVVSLIVSDVAGNDVSVIGSGPTSADLSTFAEAKQVLEKHGIWNDIPDSVKKYLEEGILGQAPETPKVLGNAYNFVIGSNNNVLEAMALKAKDLGFKPIIITSKMDGNSVEEAKINAERILHGNYEGYKVMLFGGETTYKSVKGRSVGRNQQYIAQTMISLADLKGRWAAASLDSDGIDYLSKAAGAIVDSETYARIKAGGISLEDEIKNNTIEDVFKELKNALIFTGDTGTNVGDVAIYLFE